MKKLFMYGALALLSVTAVSCHGDDPLVNGNGAPVVRTTNTLSGYVTDANGNPVAGAKVTCGDQTTTTDSNGYYSFDNVPAGTNTVVVESNGTTQTREVEVTDNGEDRSSNTSSSFTIFRTTKSNEISNGESATVTSDYRTANPKAETTIEAEVEPGTFADDNVKIWITPLYTEETAEEATRAGISTFLLGAKVNCNRENVTPQKDVTVTFNVDPSVSQAAEFKEYRNGQWVKITPEIQGDKVIIKTRNLDSFGIFANLTDNVKKTSTAITFTPNAFDNIEGSNTMNLSPAAYSYKTGVETITNPANKLQAYILDVVVRTFGVKVQTINATYQPAQTLNPGWALQLYGQQYMYTTTTSAGSANEVKYVQYDNAELWCKYWNRDHNGGGSK